MDGVERINMEQNLCDSQLKLMATLGTPTFIFNDGASG